MNVNRVVFLRFPPYFNIRNPHPQEPVLPFITAYAATVVKAAGYDVSVTDIWAESTDFKHIEKKIMVDLPEIIIAEIPMPAADAVQEILQSIKKDTSAIIIAIGSAAAAMYSLMLHKGSAVDFCVIGEPENTLVELIKTLDNGGRTDGIKGIAYCFGDEVINTGQREYIDDLDKLPYIDYGLFKKDRYAYFSLPVTVFGRTRWGFMLTSRGCPYSCIYCSPELRQSFGSEYRSQTPERVVDEMEYLVKNEKVNAIYIADDIFNHDMDRVIKICDEIINRNLKVKWVAQIKLIKLESAMLKKMKKSGCRGLSAGVESGSNRILDLLKKDTTKEKIAETVRKIKAARINMAHFFMIGNPTETMEEIEDTLKLAKEMSPAMIHVAFFTAYAGSAKSEESAPNDNAGSPSHYNRLICNYSNVDDSELRQFMRKFYLNYFLSFRFAASYIRNRLIYALFNIDRELGLMAGTLRFLFK